MCLVDKSPVKNLDRRLCYEKKTLFTILVSWSEGVVIVNSLKDIMLKIPCIFFDLSIYVLAKYTYNKSGQHELWYRITQWH